MVVDYHFNGRIDLQGINMYEYYILPQNQK